MENLLSIGAFFGGLGMLLFSFAAFWFVSEYKKKNDK